MTAMDRNHVFGPPPPIYPCKVKAVRVDGAIVTGDDAKALPAVMTFDIVVSTLDGPREIENTRSYWPAVDETVDVNGDAMIGATGWVWYIPDERRLIPMIFLPPDSIDCGDL